MSMAYRYGNRNQMALLPKSIEGYVSDEDPVRAYDAFIEALDLEALGIEINLHKVGNAEYDPKTMLKLFVYGYSYGWKSCRKLERAIHHNLSFIWLMGGLKPDYKTVSEFRRKNKESLNGVLKKCVRMCIELDLIEGNVLFVDGTKIRANAGRGRNYTKKEYERKLLEIDQNIDKLFEECERIDQGEDANESLVKMKKELVNNKSYRARIQEILNRFKKEEEEQGKSPKTINQTDPESAMMGSIQGTHASYNVQSVVDDRHGLITHADVVSDVNDVNQFSNQITQAEEVTGKECEICCGDAGYANTNELERIDRRGTRVIVPSQRQALHNREDKPFSKDKFDYDKDLDCYYCPEGHKLVYAGMHESGKSIAYRINDANICKQCSEKLERQYEQSESQEVYKRRKSRVEHPFGHIKRNLSMTNFLLRGREGVQAELSIAATCFNIARMITLFGGVKKFMVQLSTV
jgi:transposase